MFQQILNQLAERERQITLDGFVVVKESLEMVQFLKKTLKGGQRIGTTKRLYKLSRIDTFLSRDTTSNG